MSIVSIVYLPEGIAIAADSRSTLSTTKTEDGTTTIKKFSVSDNAQKIVICTPKVRQTFGGVYFYERKEKKKQKILARIQNICYNGYARTSFKLR